MNDLETATAQGEMIRARAGRYLTFFIEDEEYGFEIHRVREILGSVAVTAVPSAPPSVRGVLNRRGTVIPVIDLRRRFGFEEMADTENTCIIIVVTEDDPAGIVVDRVSEVIEIEGDDLAAPSALIRSGSDGYLMGFAKNEGGIKILLDVDEVLRNLSLSNRVEEAHSEVLVTA